MTTLDETTNFDETTLDETDIGGVPSVGDHPPEDLSDEAEWEDVLELGAGDDGLEGVARMRVTHAGLREVKESEGFSSTPYLDTIAKPPVWTQGFGDTKGVGPNSRPVTRAQAEKRLIQRFEDDFAWALEPFVGLEGFNQNMYDALASFIWNVGPGGVAADTTIGKRLRARDWPGAADAMLAWNKAGGVVVQGLVNRRQRERKLFLTPAGHPDEYYLTTWERETVAALERERTVARRHGGWENVDPSHLKIAGRAKSDLRRRLELLLGQDVSKLHRRQRVAALRQAIA